MEVVDIFVINKSDRKGADDTGRDIQQMLELSVASDWELPILMTVATDQQGVDALWEVATNTVHTCRSGELASRRSARVYKRNC